MATFPAAKPPSNVIKLDYALLTATIAVDPHDPEGWTVKELYDHFAKDWELKAKDIDVYVDRKLAAPQDSVRGGQSVSFRHAPPWPSPRNI